MNTDRQTPFGEPPFGMLKFTSFLRESIVSAKNNLRSRQIYFYFILFDILQP